MGQGTSAKAALLERIPFQGFVLSEGHCRKLEIQLTEFLLAQMKQEGSSHYRPEAVQCSEGTPTPKRGGEEQGGPPEKKPRGRPAKPTPKDSQVDTTDEAPPSGDGADAKSPLPW